MTVTVFLETPQHSEQIATFADESIFLACLPSLELLASKLGAVITESVDEVTQ